MSSLLFWKVFVKNWVKLTQFSRGQKVCDANDDVIIWETLKKKRKKTFYIFHQTTFGQFEIYNSNGL